jgi:hypothetical protein
VICQIVPASSAFYPRQARVRFQVDVMGRPLVLLGRPVISTDSGATWQTQPGIAEPHRISLANERRQLIGEGNFAILVGDSPRFGLRVTNEGGVGTVGSFVCHAFAEITNRVSIVGPFDPVLDDEAP